MSDALKELCKVLMALSNVKLGTGFLVKIYIELFCRLNPLRIDIWSIQLSKGLAIVVSCS